MPGLDKDRFRNKTISFRMSPEERRLLEAKIKISGMKKGEYFRIMLLQTDLNIRAGKYESDRLSVELKEMRNHFVNYLQDDDSLEVREIMLDCIALLNELINVSL